MMKKERKGEQENHKVRPWLGVSRYPDMMKLASPQDLKAAGRQLPVGQLFGEDQPHDYRY